MKIALAALLVIALIGCENKPLEDENKPQTETLNANSNSVTDKSSGTDVDAEPGSTGGRKPVKKSGNISIFGKYQKEAKVDQTKLTLSTLVIMTRAYYLDVGQPPESLKDLTSMPEGLTKEEWKGPYLVQGDKLPTDAWEKELKYERLENKKPGSDFRITSAGPDQVFGTGDDLKSDDKD